MLRYFLAIELTNKQAELFDLIKSDSRYIMGLGGSRSGKTFGFTYACILRALIIPNSRTGVFRSTMKACRETLFDLSFPEVIRKYNPDLFAKLEINKSEMTIKFPNGSVIVFGGVDDEHRLEQILGQEFQTIYVNEVSQIKAYKVISTMITRLNQKNLKEDGTKGRPKFFFDCNPPSTKHWAYKVFVQKVRPDTGTPLPKPEDWVSIQMNPVDNLTNLDEDYLENLQNLSYREQRRFIEGEWQSEVDGALFQLEWIDEQRTDKVDRSLLMRTVVAVDPATSANEGSDETGIVVGAIDENGHGYVLADYSVKGTPETWAREVSRAYEDWQCDLVVYEANQGGLMVETTLRSAGLANLPLKAVHASKGKFIRAEPISLLYEKGKVSHVGEFAQLEDQLANFTQSFNRTKLGSPDRLDALVWALTELMLERQHVPSEMIVQRAAGFWA